MERPSTRRQGLNVAVTGATGDLGSLLLPRLEADERIGRILAIDVAKPKAHGPKVDYRRVDLTQHSADVHLAQALIDAKIDVLLHLAFVYGRVHSAAFAHELEVIGSMHVLSAVRRASVGRLVIPSMTALYGARPQNPALLTEDAPLLGCPGSRFINDKVEVEHQFAAFRRAHADIDVLVLRFAPIVGPNVDNPVTRWLRTRVVPTLLGFDPPWQVIHENDAIAALHHAVFSGSSGAYNVVGPGLLSLSGLVRRSGGAPVPLPGPLARAAVRLLEATGVVAAVPVPLFDYLHFGWVADDRRSRERLGFVPRHHATDAAASLRGS